MKIAITGHDGFIGSHLLNTLIYKKGFEKNSFICIDKEDFNNNENLKNYDAFIFTYHDQALIPFKIISNYEGVNFTSNLNIIRVSPSHGTAEKLIGSNKVISKGIINCFNLIKKINKNRNKIDNC